MRLFVITGTCGAGKSTMRDVLPEMLDPERFVCVDSDEVGLNWWDYAGTDREKQYGNDTLKNAIGMAKGKNLVFVSCMAPHDYITNTILPEEVGSTFCIALWAPDGIIEHRLRARPAERGFTSDEAIRPHLEYNQWIGRNKGKYQLFIDTENQTPEMTAGKIAGFISKLPD